MQNHHHSLKKAPLLDFSSGERAMLEEDREKEKGTHTHKSLHLQDWDEGKSSVLLLVEELWVRKHLSLLTWTKRSMFVSKYKDHILYLMLHMCHHIKQQMLRL